MMFNLIKLLDIMSRYAPVKDIRIPKYKNTGESKDFAFIEFYSQEVSL